MISALILFFGLIILHFFLARLLIKALYLLFFLLTNNKTASIHLLAYLLLPGTLVHEVSHLFMAGVLGVPTGELSIIPQIEDKAVKTGTLKIAKVDPFRRTIIGLAPTLVGSGLMLFISSFLLKLETLNLEQILALPDQPLNFLFLYLLLTISLSMFSSKKDLEAIFIPLFILACFLIAFYLGGFKLSFSEKVLEALASLLQNLNNTFLLTILLELVLLLITRLFLLLSQRLLKKYVKI